MIPTFTVQTLYKAGAATEMDMWINRTQSPEISWSTGYQQIY